jgi:peptidoglycan/xylan/chitin deacetylase (PgdA/CDA1 family)
MKLLLQEMFWRLLRFFGWEISSEPRMTVLFYHSVSDGDDFFAVSPKMFEEQMQYLHKYYDVVPLSRAFLHAAGTLVRRNSVALTFDDGYRDFIEQAQPVLERFHFPATLFVLSDSPDRRELGNEHPLMAAADVSKLNRTLVDIGSHGLSHRKLSKLPFPDAKAEIEESRDAILARYGTSPAYLAYPKGSFNDAVKQAVKNAGFKGALSVIQRGVHQGDDPYALPRVQVDSLTTKRIFWSKLTIAADWYYGIWSLLHGGRK